jgi:HlyD family secretion protein
MMKKLVTFGLIIAVLVTLVAVRKMNGNHAQLMVTSEQATEQVLSDSILASGNLVFNTQIQIRSEVTGIVTQVLVEEGQLVEKNQVLMQLDPTRFEADVASYQAAVNAQSIEIEYVTELSRDLQRQVNLKQKLFAQNLVGQDQVDSLASQFKVSQIKVKAAKENLNQKLAALDLAKDQLNKTTFKAAMPGLISAVDVKPGETVIAGTTNIVGSALMTLADPRTILAELRVDEADIASVMVQQQVEVFTSGSPKTALNGKVVSIGSSARSAGQGRGLIFRVKVLIQSDKQLYPGMSCRAEIITAQSEPALSISLAAVHQTGDQHFVWLIENDLAKKQVVTVGMSTDTKQSITSGLNDTDVVVTGPSRLVSTLKNGVALSTKDVVKTKEAKL